ncbi:hypothetical protein [Altererythrobacter sp. MF3-039]|uniref:hypothetical protein n=1 Tax=Altererythrobacter sp. MF3-039 TaxID=3252901 RepID=UPI00390C9612
MATRIATWFVADNQADATFFPQVGARSDCSEAQAVYWRCAVVFFTSSLAVNPHAPHAFYTNCEPPEIDGLDIGLLFERWGIEVVQLPITFRLDSGAVESWGNQFYVFDILRHFVHQEDDEQLVLLDSDCIWLEPVDTLAEAIAEHGALTYPLDDNEHREGEPINGLSREGMARFTMRHGAKAQERIEYCGGEIIAVDRLTAGRIVESFAKLWPHLQADVADSPREEAHLLSVIYALEGIAIGTAERFIRRMWTTFRYNNLAPSDRWLTLWHLPAEKRTGFTNLFERIAADPAADPRTGADALGLTFENYCTAMGWPHRGPVKFIRDLAHKLSEKFR